MKRTWLIAVALSALAALGCAHRPPTPRPGEHRERFSGAPALPQGYLTARDASQAVKQGLHARVGPELAEAGDDVTVERDVPYGRVGAATLTLDLYRPRTLADPVPGLLFVHGGGWSAKGKDFYTYWSLYYARRGYVCASVEYRVSSEALYPAAVKDVKCAIKWMRANALELGVDPERIGLVGQSAGAHLAMMAAYDPEDAAPQLSGARGASTHVQALVQFYGPTDLTLPDELQANEAVHTFLGKTYEDAPELYAEASPITYVTQDDPPTLVFHGTVDDIVPVSHADALVAKLVALKVPVWYDRQEGWHHAMDLVLAINQRCLYIMDQFLDAYLPLPPKEVANAEHR